ncbi:MAG: acyl-CoA/acyl-ACP dehydrogenase [Deltaproteobacteria bacterium]|nr:acyl-CoA/acyl-ACP dehydrogenase [Deltaproteobacteria bacterium]
MPLDTLYSEQTIKIKDTVKDFVSAVPKKLLLDMDAERINYPRDYLEEAGRRGILGLRFDKEWGGKNMGWTTELAALEEVGVLGTSLACLYSLVSIVGEAIHCFGTHEQKKKYLRPMIMGKLAPAEALTEPRGGSDFFGATTVATRKGDLFYLNGQKRFVVGSEGADLFLVYARVEGIDDPHKAMTAFLVERSDTVEVKHVYGLMGTRGGGTGRLVFRDTPVPISNVLGEESGIGRGSDVFHQMMVPERMTSAGGAVGMGRAAIEVAARYADRRKAFGQKIRRFEAVSFKIAESLTLLDAARSLNYTVGRACETGGSTGKIRRLVSEAKKFSTETAWTVVNHAMQVMGGIGYTNVFPIERMLRDVRLITIWTGTNEIMNQVIQHEYYKEFSGTPLKGRDTEMDAEGSDLEGEKIYE